MIGPITKVNGKDRVMDFRDQLSLARKDDYAAIHNGGGLDNEGYPSVIRMTICDYSSGKGDGKSVTVSANIEPTVFDEWFDVCKANLGSTAIPLVKQTSKEGGKPWEHDLVANEIGCLRKNFVALINCTLTGLSGVIKVFAGLCTGKFKRGSEEEIKAFGAAFKEAQMQLKNATSDLKTLQYKRAVDYNFTQDKVNIYKKGPDGFAPVNRVFVTHQAFRPKDGDMANYPWTLKITNGEARVVEKDTGAMTFDGKTLRNQTEAYIQVSDRDMYRMMRRITGFITIWENANGIPLILEGRARAEEERRSYASRR